MKKAVTLVELIVAIVIIAILAGLAIPKQSGYIEDGFEAAFDAVERNMYNNVELIAIRYQQGIEKELKYKDLSGTTGTNTSVFFDSWHNVNTSGGITYNTGKLHTGTGAAGNGTIGSTGLNANDCDKIFHALSGVGQKAKYVAEVVENGVVTTAGVLPVDLGFGTHAYDNSVKDNTVTTGDQLICKFKTPVELGKAQRVYEYNVQQNTLIRTS